METRKWKPENGNHCELNGSYLPKGHYTKKYKKMKTRKWKPENGNHCE